MTCADDDFLNFFFFGDGTVRADGERPLEWLVKLTNSCEKFNLSYDTKIKQ